MEELEEETKSPDDGKINGNFSGCTKAWYSCDFQFTYSLCLYIYLINYIQNVLILQRKWLHGKIYLCQRKFFKLSVKANFLLPLQSKLWLCPVPLDSLNAISYNKLYWYYHCPRFTYLLPCNFHSFHEHWCTRLLMKPK